MEDNRAIEEKRLIETCLANVRGALGDRAVEYEFSAKSRGGAEMFSDGRMIVRGPWGKRTFAVEARRMVTQATAGALLAGLLERQPNPTLLADYISPAAADILRAQGINFVDAAGNMFLKSGPLFVRLTGHKRSVPAHRPARAFQIAGLKILSLLLWEPAMANAAYRTLAEHAGVSLGAIVPVFEDLARDGFIRATKHGRQLFRQRELLERWTLGYAGQLFPRIFLQTCRQVHGRKLEDLAESVRRHRGATYLPATEETLLGGEAAAGLMTGYLRPARATVHLAPRVAMSWMAQARLVADPQGDIDLVLQFGNRNQWNKPPAAMGDVPIASPVLVYGELLRLGHDARLREAADKVLEQFILPRFEEGA